MWKSKIEEAYQLIRGEIRQTPLEYSRPLSKLTGANVFLKLENYQLSGSFKLRGVMNKMLRLSQQEVNGGLVACSTGNHGAAFAHAVDKFGYKGLLFLPENASEAKLDALRQHNIDIDFYGNDCLITESHARAYARDHTQILFHPYNDSEIVCGQGTIGYELEQQLDHLPDVVIAPIGGGGLIGGVGAYLKSSGNTEVIGCQPVNSAVMHESMRAGRVVELESLATLSDATAGGIETDSITFELCQSFVDDIYLVEEDEIKHAIKLLVEYHQMIVEGAAAMTISTLLNQSEKFRNRTVVLILSGKKLISEQLINCLMVE